MTWRPIVGDGSDPIYERLADAIERDVATGALAPGTRLPPHRDLAHLLGLGVGTVSKAYAEAERRGLLSGHVGRGSFVSGGAEGSANSATGPSLIDFGRNLPPPAPAARRLADALARLRGRQDLAEAATYSQVEGLPRTRAAGAEWLRARCGLKSATVDRLVQVNGGQHGLGIALSALCRPGDGIMCDAATFFGIRMIAEYSGYRLHGLAMDRQGVTVETIEETVGRTQARVLYVMPTLQNPTARTLGAKRRREIAKVAERLDLIVLEDDVYRPYVQNGPELPTFADLIPDRTYHVASVSKSICPGLRLGFILPPAEKHTTVMRAAQAAGWSPSALGGMVFTQWLEDGTLDAILAETIDEVGARVELAGKILGQAMETPSHAATPHVWLPMALLEAERAAGRALRAGVQVTPVDASLVDPELVCGIRLCIGAVSDRAAVSRGLETVRDALQEEVAGRSVAFV